MKWLHALAGGLLLASAAQSPAASTIAYQGRLAASGGGTPPTATFSMKFSLHSAAAEGDPVWTEIQSVAVENGLYSIELGSEAPFAEGLFNENPELWLETALDSNEDSIFESSEIFTPRVHFTAAPYAFAGSNGETIGGGGGVTLPGAPENSAPLLGTAFEVGEGTVEKGAVVSLYSDGKVRQSASGAPWAEREIGLPGNGDNSTERLLNFLQHTPLANGLFLISYVSESQTTTGETKVVQIGARFDSSTREIEFGTPVTVDENKFAVPPFTVVLEDGSDGNWPLTLTTYGGTETHYEFGLSSVNPTTLDVLTTTTRFTTGVRFDREISVTKMTETPSHYIVAGAGTTGIYTYSVQKKEGLGEPDLNRTITLIDANTAIRSATVGRLTDDLMITNTGIVSIRTFSPTVGLAGSTVMATYSDSSDGRRRCTIIPISDTRFATQDQVFFLYDYISGPPASLKRLGQSAATTFDAGTGAVLSNGAIINFYGSSTRLAMLNQSGAVFEFNAYKSGASYATAAVQDGYLFMYRNMRSGTTARNFVRIVRPDSVMGVRIGVSTAEGSEGETIPVALDGLATLDPVLDPYRSYYGTHETMYGYPQTGVGTPDGRLTTTANDFYVGRALSETEILLRLP